MDRSRTQIASADTMQPASAGTMQHASASTMQHASAGTMQHEVHHIQDRALALASVGQQQPHSQVLQNGQVKNSECLCWHNAA